MTPRNTGYHMIPARPMRFAPGFPRCTCLNGRGTFVRLDLIDSYYARGWCDKSGFIGCRKHVAIRR